MTARIMKVQTTKQKNYKITDLTGNMLCTLKKSIHVHQKKKNIMKKVTFDHSFLKMKPIYYIDSLHKVKYFKPLFLVISMIMAYR